MAKKGSKQKWKLGAIVAIPLPGKKFAFAKLFQSLNFGVYDLVSSRIEPVDQVIKHKIVFFQAARDSAIKSGQWPIIGEEPFPDEEAAWAPPKITVLTAGDKIDPKFVRLSHKGKLQPGTPKDIAGMDLDFFADDLDAFVEIIVDRVIKGQHEKYQVPR